MYILGISAFYHDSSAALLKDGVVVAAFEEERFSRIKHDSSFPYNSINACLGMAGIKITDINYVAYYEKPLLRFERVLDLIITNFPFTVKIFAKAIPEWIGEKIKVEQKIRKLGFRKNIFFIPHHLSHASVSYYLSGFKKAAILTLDGIGEYQTTGIWKANENVILPIAEINFPHSVGLLYSVFTSFLGFKVNEDEYKVMGLAAYGKPIYKEKIYKLIDLKEDGSFKLNVNYFRFSNEDKMWSSDFENLFGKPRVGKLIRKHQDIAASIQEVTEELVFKMLNYLYFTTKTSNLCMGGGVALNSLLNGKIYKNTPFKNVYIFGPSSDAGSSIGAALYTYHGILEFKKIKNINNLFLGAEFSDEQIEKTLLKNNLKFKKTKNAKELVKQAAEYLAQDKIIAWFQGRAEFGPRALGGRSILANPQKYYMKDKINRIKIRELFRPFAGSILEEKVEDYFVLPKAQKEFPFMNFCFPVKKEKRNSMAAIVHKDGTCRIQTVNKNDGPYYLLLKEFFAKTKIPVLLNTSFNIKGEPIINSPEEAVEDFLESKIDYLVMGSFIIYK